MHEKSGVLLWLQLLSILTLRLHRVVIERLTTQAANSKSNIRETAHNGVHLWFHLLSILTLRLHRVVIERLTAQRETAHNNILHLASRGAPEISPRSRMRCVNFVRQRISLDRNVFSAIPLRRAERIASILSTFISEKRRLRFYSPVFDLEKRVDVVYLRFRRVTFTSSVYI